jgi:hypothetical protein
MGVVFQMFTEHLFSSSIKFIPRASESRASSSQATVTVSDCSRPARVPDRLVTGPGLGLGETADSEPQCHGLGGGTVTVTLCRLRLQVHWQVIAVRRRGAARPSTESFHWQVMCNNSSHDTNLPRRRAMTRIFPAGAGPPGPISVVSVSE